MNAPGHHDDPLDTADDAEFYRQFGAMEATVFHGTRQSLAEAILRDGFRPTTVADQVAAVADAHGVPLDALRDQLRRMNAFTTLDSRLGKVSTTADRYRAGSWADSAPEATREALKAVYVLTHPERGDDYASGEEAGFWVMAQRLADPPVVVEVRSNMGALRAWGFSAGPTAPEALRNLIEGGSPHTDPVDRLTAALMDFRDQFRLTPEWRIRVEDVRFIAAKPVAARVSDSLLAFLSDQSVMELERQLRDGVWGEPGNPGVSSSRWWPFDQVWSRLTPQRRAKLEEIALLQIRADGAHKFEPSRVQAEGSGWP